MRFPSPPLDGLEPACLPKAAGEARPQWGSFGPATFGRLRIN